MGKQIHRYKHGAISRVQSLLVDRGEKVSYEYVSAIARGVSNADTPLADKIREELKKEVRRG